MALIERLAILIDANSQGASREFKKLSGDAKATETQLTRTQVASKKFGDGIKVLGTVAAGAAVAGLAKFADASLDAASALEETRSKAQVVFGTQFSQIERFATDTADALNLSERAAFQFASAFGQLFDSAGLADEQAANYSETLTTLAADLASFNDISVDEAFQKLRSGLSGEAEPLRQVGVFLSAAKVEAEAYSSGIAAVGSELTEAEKIQARYNIILRETKTAQGDVARTAESYANQQRDLQASLEDLQAAFGETFSGEAAKAVGILADLADATTAVNDTLSGSGGLVGSIGNTLQDAVSGIIPGFSSLVEQLGRAGEFFDAIGVGGDDTAASLSQLNEEIYNSGRGIADLDPATRGLIDSLDEGSESAESMGSATAYLSEESTAASDAIKELSDAIELLRSPVLDVRDANRAVAEAVDEAAAAFEENGRTLDINTEKGRANQEALDGIAEAAFDALDAYAQNGASASDLRERTERLRAKLVEAGERFGLTRAEARQYADQLGLIPGNVTTNVRLAGIDSAIAQAKRLQELTTGLGVGQLTSVVRQDRAMENRRASGGPVGPGTYLVGERGPELLSLSSGTGRVFSNAQTRPMLSSNNSRNLTVNGDVVIQTPDPSRTWDQLNMLAVA